MQPNLTSHDGRYPLLAPSRVAERLNVSTRTVLRMVARGTLSAIIIGHGTVRVRPESLEALIEARADETARAVAQPSTVNRPRTFVERFWRYVDKTGECWEWTGATNGRYGHISRGPGLGLIGAHRASWEIHFGPIPAGLWVLHRCDNPPCVRPEHLFLGTDQDNTNDKVAKGRHVKRVI